MKRLLLLHTVSPLIEVFDVLCARLLPGVKVLHILDEPLLKMVQGEGGTEQDFVHRLEEHVSVAEKLGIRVMLVTCSSVSLLLDKISRPAAIEVMKIDDAMVESAVERGNTIGVVATASSTLDPTRQALLKQADDTGKKIEVKTLLVERALELLIGGDGEAHDRLVGEAVMRMSGEVEVVVLAQASMARVLDVLSEEERSVPVLSSPHLALEKIKKIL